MDSWRILRSSWVKFKDLDVIIAAPVAEPVGDGDDPADFEGDCDFSVAGLEGGEDVGELAKPDVKQVLGGLREQSSAEVGERGGGEDRAADATWLVEEDAAHAIVREYAVVRQFIALLAEDGGQIAALAIHTSQYLTEPIDSLLTGQSGKLGHSKVNVKVGVVLSKNQVMRTRVDEPSESGCFDAEGGGTAKVADFLFEQFADGAGRGEDAGRSGHWAALRGADSENLVAVAHGQF